MAKQKKKKAKAKKKISNKVEKKTEGREETVKAILPHAVSRDSQDKKKREIPFSEKIVLEKSSHTYKTAIQRRYGKYYRKVKKPAHLLLKFVLVVLTMTVVAVA